MGKEASIFILMITNQSFLIRFYPSPPPIIHNQNLVVYFGYVDTLHCPKILNQWELISAILTESNFHEPASYDPRLFIYNLQTLVGIELMLETQKLFIQRQLTELVNRDLSSKEVLEKSLTILRSKETTDKALAKLKDCGSLTKTLHQLNIIQLEQSTLDVVAAEERLSSHSNIAFTTLLDTNQTIGETFNLLKMRLSIGLGYALWLSIIATTIFSIITLKVLPQFEELFMGFGAELPQFTQMALSWQNSFFSPTVIGVLFTLIIIYLLVSIHRLSKNNIQRSMLSKIPFIRNVLNFTENIRWLSQLRILRSTGLDLNNCLEKLKSHPGTLKKYSPDLISELKAADEINNLENELEYQIHQLNQLAEKIVTNAARNLVAVVMAFVISYVVFTIFASYLPIFQLGAVI